jgi:hypothetical protein
LNQIIGDPGQAAALDRTLERADHVARRMTLRPLKRLGRWRRKLRASRRNDDVA